MDTPHWEHYEHQADIGVRGYGTDLGEAYVQAALALSAVITQLDVIQDLEPVAIRCEAPDPELLLVDWLNALIYEMATRHMLFSRFDITVCGNRLNATAWGEGTRLERHAPAVEVKGATYTTLKVEQHADGLWMAQTVVDV